jgi:hypothetical protein
MEDNNNNINSEDRFSEIFRQKLENHQLPIDDKVWNTIEKQLKPKRKKIALWMWIPIGTAAMLALIFTLRPYSESTSSITKINPKSEQQSDLQISELAEIHEDTISTSGKLQKEVVADKLQPKQTKANFQNTNKQTNLTEEYAYVVEEPINSKPTSAVFETDSIVQPKIETKDSTSKIPGKRYVPNTLIAESEIQPMTEPKKQNNWMLAAAFGSGGSEGGGKLFGNADMLYTNGTESLVSAVTKNTQILTPNDFSSKMHLPPVSFGVVIRRNLTKTLSLQSGLMYTYLLSTFENTGVQHYDAKLHLHYIGLPLNLITKIWTNPKWDIYFSTGGAIEKGIRSNYIQNQYYGNQTYTTRADTNISGLQWSINAGFGTTYKLNRKFGIYFEPKINYYLNNNQPMSARTEQPLVVGINAGLQYDF